MATIDDLARLDLRVGRVLSVAANQKARRPAFVLDIDFGSELGVKRSSAQVTERHRMEELIGRLVVAVVNFPARYVAGVRSEVLVLAAVGEGGATLLTTSRDDVEPGSRIA